MYTIEASEPLRGKILENIAWQESQNTEEESSLRRKIRSLFDNPFIYAKETNIQTLGKYYLNAGRFCITFNVDVETQNVRLTHVMLSILLHKLMTGWPITAPVQLEGNIVKMV